MLKGACAIRSSSKSQPDRLWQQHCNRFRGRDMGPGRLLAAFGLSKKGMLKSTGTQAFSLKKWRRV
jgi:hypothetical protein